MVRATAEEQRATQERETEDHFHKVLVVRRLRKVSGKVFARLGVGLGLSGIFGRRRGRGSGTTEEQASGDEGEDELRSGAKNVEDGRAPMSGRVSSNKGDDFGLFFHETCGQRNVFNLPQAGRQYEEQILMR